MMKKFELYDKVFFAHGNATYSNSCQEIVPNNKILVGEVTSVGLSGYCLHRITVTVGSVDYHLHHDDAHLEGELTNVLYK